MTKDKGFRRALLSLCAYVANPFRLRAAYLRYALRSTSPKQIRQRIEVLRRFKTIHQAVHCATSEDELFFIADEILRIPSDREGDIIECGVYKGGSTCKLSVVAKLMGRRLIACDSFSGLPEPKDFDTKHVLSNGSVAIYKKGDYLSTMDEVRANLQQFGEPDAVELVQGYFQDTLPLLKEKKFALVFIDVDLYESVICCIENLWPALQPGCRFFTHEAPHLLTVQAFTDKDFWRNRFGIEPPVFVGGGTGLGRLKRVLGFVEKPL